MKTDDGRNIGGERKGLLTTEMRDDTPRAEGYIPEVGIPAIFPEERRRIAILAYTAVFAFQPVFPART